MCIEYLIVSGHTYLLMWFLLMKVNGIDWVEIIQRKENCKYGLGSNMGYERRKNIITWKWY